MGKNQGYLLKRKKGRGHPEVDRRQALNEIIYKWKAF
jgi:hypothetical protein